METLRVIICEDDPAEQEILSGLLKKSPVPVSPAVFQNGEELLKSFYPGCCDLILMDIFMGELTGVQTVAQIRTTDPAVRIAFMTTSPDFTMDGYRYKVDRYLLKPVRQEDLNEVLLMASRESRHKPSISLSVQGRERFIPYSDISYAEQNGHTVCIHLTSGEILKVSTKLSLLSEQLSSPPFYQFHKSFLLNMMHVRYLDSELKAFVMNGGGCAYIRRTSLREAQETYSRFMFDQIKDQEDS